MSFKFKNTGQDLNEIRKRLAKDAIQENQDLFPLSPKTPLRKGIKNGETLFEMNFDLLDQISDNLRNLIMTQKGERIGRGNFGTNLYRIYSNTNIENPDELAIQEISETVSTFMPQVSLEDFTSEKINNGPDDFVIYNINIYYSVPAISSEKRSISVNLKMTK